MIRYTLDAAGERDAGVQYAVWLLGVGLAVLNPAFRGIRWLLRRWQWQLGAAYLYSVLWGALLVGLWLAGLGAVAAVIASVRLAEILIWYAMALLDRGHRFVLSHERSLLILFADSLIAVTCIGLMLRVPADDRVSFSHWLDGLSVLTLNGQPGSADRLTAWQSAGVAVGTFAGLLLVGAGLALIVGLITKRFELGQHRYTGPMRPPWPGAHRFRDLGEESGSRANEDDRRRRRGDGWS